MAKRKKEKTVNILRTIRKLESVLDTTGIYPKSIVGGKNAYKERNDYQNGWNACMIEMTKRIGKALYKREKKENKDLTLLLLAEVMYENHGHYVLDMSDTFYFASADNEEVKMKEMKEVARLFTLYGLDGLNYWVAGKRGHDPEIPKNKAGVEYVRAREKGTEVKPKQSFWERLFRSMTTGRG